VSSAVQQLTFAVPLAMPEQQVEPLGQHLNAVLLLTVMMHVWLALQQYPVGVQFPEQQSVLLEQVI
jgi:hypothetical protein